MGIQLDALKALIAELVPGAKVQSITPLDTDTHAAGELTEKGAGYGVPLRVTLVDPVGRSRDLVWHTATANPFGHDRRSDRAQQQLLAFDTFGSVPLHVSALDVGTVRKDGALQSLRDSDEFYLITEFARGTPYAADLRRIAHRRALDPVDERRCDQLAGYLAALHGRPLPAGTDRDVAHTRAIRDLLGHGEGIFGIIDGYPDNVPGVSATRLRGIEERCWRWRWKLRGQSRRLAVTHGDFHPFNILFDQDDRLSLLDASRGCLGDPADDVACLAINFVFFALEDRAAWRNALGILWARFWHRYIEATGDEAILAAAPPFLAWRTLVLANPAWYPALSAESRNRLLTLAERALDAPQLTPDMAEMVFS